MPSDGRAIWFALALAAGPLAACVNYDEITRIRLRDPSQVAVSVEAPDGARTLLSPGRREEGALVPASTPPYLEEAYPGSVVNRLGSGAVTLRCPECAAHVFNTVVDSDGVLDLRGTPDDTLTWLHEGLAMRFNHPAMLPCHRVRGLCERDDLTLGVSTPGSNVLEIHHVRTVARTHGELTGAWIGLAAGVVTTLFGIAMPIASAAYGWWSTLDSLGLTAGFVGVGTFFVITGIAGITATNSDTRLDLPALPSGS